MVRLYIKMIFYVFISLIMSLMILFISKMIEKSSLKDSKIFEKGKVLRLFSIKYYWLIGIILFIILIIIDLI